MGWSRPWFLPESKLPEYNLKEEEFVLRRNDDGEWERVHYEKGTFIFRLRGRERQETASYYTPSVLTEAVVRHTLKEILPRLSADEVLKLTVLEPAMGSGSFLNEAVNQLAEASSAKRRRNWGSSWRKADGPSNWPGSAPTSPPSGSTAWTKTRWPSNWPG